MKTILFHFILVLVIKACGVFASNNHISSFKTFRNSPLSTDFQIPYNFRKSYNSDFSLQRQYVPTRRMPQQLQNDLSDATSPSSFLLNPKNWHPPKYVQLLKNFDEALLDIRSHLKHASTVHKDDDSKFFTISHVVNGLAVHVAQYGWKSFHDNYAKLVRTLVDDAKRDPQGAIDDMNCIMNAAVQNTLKIRKVITHPWIDYLCNTKPASCDTIIHAVVKSSSDKELNQQAEDLPFLGKTGRNYIKLYSDYYNEALNLDVLTYLWTKKISLQRIVYINSFVRRQIFPRGDKCTVQISPSVNMFRF